MKKFNLNLEDLEVDSFTTNGSPASSEGTVKGQFDAYDHTENPLYCTRNDVNCGTAEDNTTGNAILCGCWSEGLQCNTNAYCTDEDFCTDGFACTLAEGGCTGDALCGF